MKHNQYTDNTFDSARALLKDHKSTSQEMPISQMCKSISKLINANERGLKSNAEREANDHGAFQEVLRLEQQRDSLWGNISTVVAQLSARPAATYNDITAKILIWRTLAPERTSDEAPSLDEVLIESIVGDVEALGIA